MSFTGSSWMAPTGVLTERTTAFLAATGITDSTIIDALNTLDLGLISNAIDTKFKAIYPIVGGSATTHKYNFMNPADTDAAFRLTFNGGWTHSSTGALPASNGYARTYITPSTHLTQDGAGISYYSRTDANSLFQTDMGCFDGSKGLLLRSRQSSTNSNAVSVYCQGGAVSTSNNTSISSQAWYYLGRTNSGTITILRNSTDISLSSTSTGNTTREIYLAALNLNGSPTQYGQRECAFASIDTGLTVSEAQTFYILIQAFQTSLSRNV